MLLWRLTAIFLFAIVAAQSSGLANTPANEQTLKAFRRADFTLALGAATSSPTISVLQPDDSLGWMWSPLFDGTADSSLLVNLSAPSLFGGGSNQLANHALLTVANPSLGQNHNEAAIVGRWGSPLYDISTANISKIALTLTVDFENSPSATAVVYIHAGGPAMPCEDFRLPINVPPGGKVKQLSLFVTTGANVPLIFEDIRLVQSGGAPPVSATLPQAGLPPVDSVPEAKNECRTFDFDPWSQGQSGVEPVFIDASSSSETLRFRRRPADGSLRRVSLVSIDAPLITAGDFGVTGRINYAGLEGKGDFDGSAYFELTASFADGTSRVVGTTAPFGPCQKISNHSGDRPMQLAMHSPMQPTRLQLLLVSDGVGQVGFSNLSFVQFDSPPVAATALPPLPSRWSDARLVRTVGSSSLLAALLLSVAAIQLPNLHVVRNGVPVIALLAGQILFAWAMFLIGREEPIAAVAPLFAGAIACVLPLLARRLVFRRLHRRELRKMLTIDAT